VNKLYFDKIMLLLLMMMITALY